MSKAAPLLSIAIPAYNRPAELEYGLRRLISQISGKYDDIVEIIICDDCSPDDALHRVRELAGEHAFTRYVRYEENVGLERNLIQCTTYCTGDYLWIFGDDDFPERDDCLDTIINILQTGAYDFLILNRTRRSFDLTKLISDNWMQLDPSKRYEFSGLREFCLRHGFISVIGFISVNIFRRAPFSKIDFEPYFGTMYPQLGAMVEAFHQSRALLIGAPMICHRTQTAEEKRRALGSKPSEANFMAEIDRRNAIYFSHPYYRMLSHLIDRGAFSPEDIVRIPENTVINGLLVDFLINNAELSIDLNIEVPQETWDSSIEFFNRLPLTRGRRLKVSAVASRIKNVTRSRSAMTSHRQAPVTISVITPSYNQANFLHACLASVKHQTFKPLEHLVFDPGSTDGSQDIAREYSHVTLIEEPDAGQSDALNKGFQRAKGDIIAWLNSDDRYFDDKVFESVVRRFQEPDQPDIVYGLGIYVDENGNKLRDAYINRNPDTLPWRLQQEDGILQPALFMRRSVIEEIGLLRTDLHFCMDYEYWIRCVKGGIRFAFMDRNLAIAAYHTSNKTYGMRGKSYREVCDMLKEHFGYANHHWLRRYAEFITDGHDGVLANASNKGVSNEQSLNDTYRRLLAAYNADSDTYNLLLERAAQKGYGDTLREMHSLGLTQATPCFEVPVDKTDVPGHVTYKVGPRRWAFDSEWKRAQIQKSHEFLRHRIATRRSDTCVIVGNGPSLNKIDLSLLEKVDIIVSNNVFLSDELISKADYYTVVNYLVAEQGSQHINRLAGVHKVIPYWLSYCINPDDNTHFVDAVGHAEFSTDIFKNMSWRHTVTFFNLHLAYGLGYRNVILVGMDHNYVQPKNVKEQDVIQEYEDDANHFLSDYFKGKKWQAADVDMMEEMYRLAKAAYEANGRRIINATVGGKLELFDRMPLEDALKLAKPPIDSIPDNLDRHPGLARTIFGPFARRQKAHLDETAILAGLLREKSSGTMIDVGAHHGTALSPFLDQGWKIFAFEPDEANRRILLDRLKSHPARENVAIDIRGVSNKSQKDIPFYRSEQSTGISGLTAFHKTHVECQKVDTITLREFFQDGPMPRIDFLKIDTEGHDLFVLQGFPWDRTQPAVVECEFEDSKTVPLGYTYRDLANFLVEKGYTVYVSEWHPIVRYGIRHDWHRLAQYPCDLADPKGWGNLLAFRDPVDESRLIAEIKRSLEVELFIVGSQASNTKDNPRQASAMTKALPVNAVPSADSAGLFSTIKRKLRPIYLRIGERIRMKSPTLFRLGQFGMWIVRHLVRRPWAVLALLMVAVCLLFSWLLPSYHFMRNLLWGTAILLLAAGGLVALILFARMKVRAAFFELSTAHRLLRQELTQRAVKLERRQAELERKESELARKQVDLEYEQGELALKHSELLNMLARFEAETANATNDTRSWVKDLSDRSLSRHSQLLRAPVFNYGEYQPFGRMLSPTNVGVLISEWSSRLGLTLERKYLYYVAHRICMIESMSRGRLATSIEAAVLRSLVPLAIRDKNAIHILEIGTLFGIGLAAMYDHARPRFESVHVTALDPLDGYYGKGVHDLITAEPISEFTLRSNLAAVGVPAEDFTLIKKLSTEPSAIEEARARPCDVLVIDGDHSYDGVKFDYDNYLGAVVPGGYIIFDDYGAPEWPGVQEFVDAKVLSDGRVTFVGAGMRTAIFRKL